jgi:hypothetical protein
MESKCVMQLKKEAKSKSSGKNKRERIGELQLIEFTYLIQPKDEEDSSDNEEATENQRQRFYVKKRFVKPRKFSRENDKVGMNPIIKDMVINKEEYAMEVKYGKQDSWGFQLVGDFFKRRIRNKRIKSIFPRD